MLMQLSAVGEQLGSAQEAPVRTQELQAPNAKLLPSEHELYETAAELKAAELDITSHPEETQPERRRHAAAVEARLAALVRSTRAAVITWDSGGKVVDWNDGATRLLGYTADQMVGCDLSVLSMAGDRPELGGSVNPTQTLYDRELVMRRKDGWPVHVAWTEAPVRDTKGNVVGSAGIGADLSERTRLERQVARLADEQRRQLGQQVHDSLGQQLTAIGLLVGTLRSRLGTGDSVADVTSNLERCVDDAKAHMRAIVKGLAPLKIDAHGLQFALAELAQGTALTHGIACRLECPHPVALHDNVTANELYLIAREAVHNAVKHGRPGSIVIRLESSQGLLLQIWDDGVGIARARERAHEGFGLRIMRHRSRLIGATLKVVRGANGGTVVTCTRTRPGQGACLVAPPTVADANGLTAKRLAIARGRRATPHACRARTGGRPDSPPRLRDGPQVRPG